jgi:hypothetical protein
MILLRRVSELTFIGGLKPSPPELKAVARAGSNVTVQWSGIIRMHLGPVMTVRCPSVVLLARVDQITLVSWRVEARNDTSGS